MIVTPEGLNVFPEDVERALNEQPGVLDSAVVGAPVAPAARAERVQAVLLLAPGTDADARRPRREHAARRSPEDPRGGGVAGDRSCRGPKARAS